MANEIDILLKVFETEWNGARHQESQRSTMANYLITVSAVAVGFQVQKGLTLETWPISLFLILLGIFGFISSQKFYERFMYHVRRATEIRCKLDREHCHLEIETLMRQIDNRQRSRHLIFHRIRLYWVWLGPPIASLVIGFSTLVQMIWFK